MRLAVLAIAAALLVTGCGDAGPAADADPPDLGACRVLAPADVRQATNSAEVVDCAEPHTAETYAVGELPEAFADVPYDDPELGAWAFDTCSTAF